MYTHIHVGFFNKKKKHIFIQLFLNVETYAFNFLIKIILGCKM